MTDDFGDEIEPFKRRKAPDEIVLRLPRARHLRPQLQRADRDIVGLPLAVAPRDAAGVFQFLGAAPFERQTGRCYEATHRSGERSEGAEGVSTGRYRCSPSL